MQVAEAFQAASRKVKLLTADLKEARSEMARLEGRMLGLVEEGKLPESFRLNGSPIYTREEIWASPADGNHEAVAAVLLSLGLVEYLPRTVNSQSISGYIREFKDEKTGELIGVPEELQAVLNITKKPRCIAAGLG